MNKIVIVGHPQSGYERIERLLISQGMASARRSRREGLTPAQISETLCKAHGVAPLQISMRGSGVPQINAGPVWFGLALDLMLSNVDQPLWGWADPLSVSLLDYWRDLDPNITFVLVYDQPRSLLTRSSIEDAARLTNDSLDKHAHIWHAYNAALLRFFQKNSGRCLLVNAQRVLTSPDHFLQLVRNQISGPWSENTTSFGESRSGASPGSSIEDRIQLGTVVGASSPPSGHGFSTGNSNGLDLDKETVMAYLADVLMGQHASAQVLFDELEAVADCALGSDGASERGPLSAWLGMTAQYQRSLEVAQLLDAQVGQIDDLNRRLKQAEAQTMRLTEESKRIPDENAQRAAEGSRYENELLLGQLHDVQLELERYYLENQRLKASSTGMPRAPVEAAALYGAGERIQQQLTYKIGATMIQHSRTVGGLVGLPLALIRVTREHRRQVPERKALKLPPIDRYRDAYEAERYRKHLSYRLGDTFLKNVKSPIGWMRMPFALRREIREFRKSKNA